MARRRADIATLTASVIVIALGIMTYPAHRAFSQSVTYIALGSFVEMIHKSMGTTRRSRR